MDNNTIQLEVTVSEANMILASLGQQPYIKVVDIIKKIQEQGVSQVGSYKENGRIASGETSKTLVENEQ